jgi:hypothetical protein
MQIFKVDEVKKCRSQEMSSSFKYSPASLIKPPWHKATTKKKSARYEAAGPPDYQGVPVAEVYREGMVACEVRSGRAGYHFPITCHNFNHVNGYNIPTIQLSSYVMTELYSITYL